MSEILFVYLCLYDQLVMIDAQVNMFKSMIKRG